MPWIGRMRNFFRCVRGHAYDLRQSPACRRAPVPAPASAAGPGRAQPQPRRAPSPTRANSYLARLLTLRLISTDPDSLNSMQTVGASSRAAVTPLKRPDSLLPLVQLRVVLGGRYSHSSNSASSWAAVTPTRPTPRSYGACLPPAAGAPLPLHLPRRRGRRGRRRRSRRRASPQAQAPCISAS